MKSSRPTLFGTKEEDYKTAFEIGLTLPIKALSKIWGMDVTTLTKWARQGKLAGAYKRGYDWWFYPRLLTEPPTEGVGAIKATVFSKHTKPARTRRSRR